MSLSEELSITHLLFLFAVFPGSCMHLYCGAFEQVLNRWDSFAEVRWLQKYTTTGI